MYHFAHIAAFCRRKSRNMRGLVEVPFAHIAKYYRMKAQIYRWYMRWGDEN